MSYWLTFCKWGGRPDIRAELSISKRSQGGIVLKGLVWVSYWLTFMQVVKRTNTPLIRQHEPQISAPPSVVRHKNQRKKSSAKTSNQEAYAMYQVRYRGAPFCFWCSSLGELLTSHKNCFLYMIHSKLKG